MSSALLISLMEMAVKYGPAAISAVSSIFEDKEEITKEDILKLKEYLKDPESYFV